MPEETSEQERDTVFDDANGDLAIGDLEAAVEKYRRCVEIDPEFFDGWHALGMALMKTDRIKEAIGAGLAEAGASEERFATYRDQVVGEDAENALALRRGFERVLR